MEQHKVSELKRRLDALSAQHRSLIEQVRKIEVQILKTQGALEFIQGTEAMGEDA